jgi:anthranilate/para-aminobenzoate synthase component II
MYKFGITMRETNAVGYHEPRDTLAQDWATYMAATFPTQHWLSIPNSGSKAVDYFMKWNLNVLILSGGDSLGVTENRDQTERCLLAYALENQIPVIGVCRGLQLIHSYFGGKIKVGNNQFIKEHRANDHQVNLNNQTYLANSFHLNKIEENSLDKQFKVIARCSKFDSIEAIQGKNILAMMWHPERKMKDNSWSNNLIINFLKRDE